MSAVSTQVSIVDKMTGPLNRITAALYNTTSACDSVDRATDAAFNPSAIQAMAQEMYGYETRIQQLEADLVDANRKLKEMEEQTQRAASAADVLKKAFGGITSALGLKKIVDASDEIVQTTSRLDMMNDGLQTTDELVQMVYRSAQNARGSLTDMADVVARFGNNVGIGENSVFKSSEEVVAFAELLQKQMVIAGASTSEASGAMLQLSQALGSGVLRGDELNSIFEASPNLIRNIATYIEKNEEVAKHMADVLDVSYEEMSTNAMGHIRDLAEEGQLSADLVKAAMFSASGDINERFANMPMTWGQVWTGMMNEVYMMSLPVLELISFLAQNWSIIEPIILGVAAALGVYLAVTKGIEFATKAWAAAQAFFNSVMALNPVFLIIMGVILLISLIYAVVAVINKVTGSTISATGIIFGAIATVVAAIWNIFLGLADLVLGIISVFINKWAMFANFFANVFNDPIGSIIHLFGDMADAVLGVVETVASALDKVFGSNLAGAVSGWRSDLDSMIEEAANKYGNGSYEKVMEEVNLTSESLGLSRWAYSDAYDSGYSFGEDLGFDDAYTQTGAGTLYDGISTIANDTSAISDGVNISNENLKYLRDIAEQEAINRFTTAEIKVDMTNNNTISNNMDIDGIINTLSDGLLEAMATTAEGVH